MHAPPPPHTHIFAHLLQQSGHTLFKTDSTLAATDISASVNVDASQRTKWMSVAVDNQPGSIIQKSYIQDVISFYRFIQNLSFSNIYISVSNYPPGRGSARPMCGLNPTSLKCCSSSPLCSMAPLWVCELTFRSLSYSLAPSLSVFRSLSHSQSPSFSLPPSFPPSLSSFFFVFLIFSPTFLFILEENITLSQAQGLAA